jgi:hypothetical protein
MRTTDRAGTFGDCAGKALRPSWGKGTLCPLRDAQAETHATNILLEGRKVPTECKSQLIEFSGLLYADYADFRLNMLDIENN